MGNRNYKGSEHLSGYMKMTKSIIALLKVESELVDSKEYENYVCSVCGHNTVSYMGDTEPKACLSCGSDNMKETTKSAVSNKQLKKFSKLDKKAVAIECPHKGCGITTVMHPKVALSHVEKDKGSIYCPACGGGILYDVSALAGMFGDEPTPKKTEAGDLGPGLDNDLGVKKDLGEDEDDPDMVKDPSPEEITGSVNVPVWSCVDVEANPFTILKSGHSKLLAMVGDTCIATKACLEEPDDIEKAIRVWAQDEENKDSNISDAVKASGFDLIEIPVAYDEVITKVSAEVVKSSKEDYDNKIKETEKILSHSLSIASMAVNRNFYQEGNPLMEAIVSNLTEYIGEENAAKLVVAGFDESGDDYLSLLKTKTIAFMEMNEDNRNQFADQLKDMKHPLSAASANGKSKSSRLRSNVVRQLENPVTLVDDKEPLAFVTSGRQKQKRGQSGAAIRNLAAKSGTFAA